MSTIAPITFTFEERVNPTYCDILAKITFKQFKQFYSETELEQNGDSIEITTQYNLLRNYCTEMIHNNYTRLSTYHYSGNKTNGRLFLKDKMGLQRIWSKFRGVLSDGITRDIDMSNAHPVLLAFICKLHKIECTKLNRYIHTRQECFADLYKTDKIVASDAKILFIKSINSCNPVDTFKKKTIKDSFFISYDQEMKAIQSKLCTIYKDLYNELKKTKPNNAEGSLVNHLLCIKENELLQKIMTAIKTYYKPSVPMFDGLMFFDNTDSGITDDALIELLNKVTLAEGIIWSFKPHNCEIKEILDNIDVTNNVNFFIGDTELDVAMYCVNHIFKNKLVKCQSEVYVYDNKIWTKNDTPNIISKIIGYHDLYIGSDTDDNLISKSTKGQDSLTKMIMRNVITDNKFNKKMYQQTLQKLCFQNGYYDFKLSKFIEYKDDNIPLTPFIIDRDYVVNKNAYADIYKRVLYPVFNIILDDNNEIIETDSNLQNVQELKYMLHKLARMIAGHAINDKQWLIFKGTRNSGKGLLYALFKNAFENYVNVTNGNNFLARPTFGEESKLLAWINDFEFTRIIFTHEITILFDKNGKSISSLDGNLIKKISGGDELDCRINHKDARKFHHQSTLVICCNEVPKIIPDDALQNLHTFNMPCSFFTDEAWDNKDEVEKLEYPLRRLADPDIKTEFCNNIDVINSFMNLIIEAYNWKVKCPNKIKEEKKSESSESDFARFMNLFEFTLKDNTICDKCNNSNKDIYCEDHIVYNSRIEELLMINRINITKQKICKLLSNITFLKAIYTSTKKRGFIGLYEKEDT
jgi:hypothetical protein